MSDETETQEELLEDNQGDDRAKPRFEPSCKLCQFSKAEVESQEIQLHEFAVEQAKQGIPYGRIAANLKKYAKQMGFPETVQPPSRKSIWNHFERHTTPIQNAVIHAARVDWVPRPDNPLVDYKVIERISKENFDEYDELCRLYSKFKEISNKIYEFDNSLKIGSPNGESAWSMNKIQTFTSMVNTQKSILSEISKMRQGDKLVAIAARFIIEEFTKNIIHKLKGEFESFIGVMRRQGVNTEIVDTFEEIATHRIVQLFTDEAGSAIELTKREFKLPN